MRTTNPYTHDIGISCAIKDVTELRAFGDSLCNNGTPIVGEKQEVLRACETARQGAVGEGSIHLDQYLVLSSAAFTHIVDLINALERTRTQ